MTEYSANVHVSSLVVPFLSSLLFSNPPAREREGEAGGRERHESDVCSSDSPTRGPLQPNKEKCKGAVGRAAQGGLKAPSKFDTCIGVCVCVSMSNMKRWAP